MAVQDLLCRTIPLQLPAPWEASSKTLVSPHNFVLLARMSRAVFHGHSPYPRWKLFIEMPLGRRRPHERSSAIPFDLGPCEPAAHCICTVSALRVVLGIFDAPVFEGFL